MNWPLVAFVFLAAVMIYSGYRVAVSPVITHAALYLTVVLVANAGMFLLLQADFLAAVQVLVYAGGIMTVIVFAIMLSALQEIRGEERSLLPRISSPYFGLMPLIGGLAIAAIVILVEMQVPWPGAARPAPTDTVTLIGHGFFGLYSLPFEVASVMLLAAMVGAIILTRREGA
jgi:NADH:ubiquinone oxidoreductase subunit 6 (subunit J)